MTTITNIEMTRDINGGAKVYMCPWKDYKSTNYWKAYGHAIVHAYRKGYFDLPFYLISRAF